jgi:SAM-dependent methyltransferase
VRRLQGGALGRAEVKSAAALAFVAFVALVPGCRRDDAPPETRAVPLLKLADFDGAARRHLSDTNEFGPGLRAGGDAAERYLHARLAQFRDADDKRVAGAFDYDLPALVRYVLAPPLPLALDVEWLLHAGEPEFARAAALARTPSDAAAGEDPALAAARRGDPLGLRPLLLRRRLERDGRDVAHATADDVAQAFAAVNRFLDDEQAVLEKHAEPEGAHFLDWFLKTTTLTGLAPKIGMVTEALLASVANLPPASVHRVLVVGPGVDLASPHLGALAPVAMYQPFEIADALRRLKLAAPDCEVDALDVNPDVLRVLEAARASAATGGSMRLALFRGAGTGRLVIDGVEDYVARLFSSWSGLPGFARGAERPALSPDVALRAAAEVRRNFAAAVARPGGPDPAERAQLEKLVRRIELEARVAWCDVELGPAAVLAVHPVAGDVVTDRFAENDRYDLVLCTNVLVYFPPELQQLALLNLRRVTRRDGLLLCTDAFGEKEGEAFCGWRLEKTQRRDGFDPQYALRCLKPR